MKPLPFPHTSPEAAQELWNLYTSQIEQISRLEVEAHLRKALPMLHEELFKMEPLSSLPVSAEDKEVLCIKVQKAGDSEQKEKEILGEYCYLSFWLCLQLCGISFPSGASEGASFTSMIVLYHEEDEERVFWGPAKNGRFHGRRIYEMYPNQTQANLYARTLKWGQFRQLKATSRIDSVRDALEEISYMNSIRGEIDFDLFKGFETYWLFNLANLRCIEHSDGSFEDELLPESRWIVASHRVSKYMLPFGCSETSLVVTDEDSNHDSGDLTRLAFQAGEGGFKMYLHRSQDDDGGDSKRTFKLSSLHLAKLGQNPHTYYVGANCSCDRFDRSQILDQESESNYITECVNVVMTDTASGFVKLNKGQKTALLDENKFVDGPYENEDY